MVDPYQMQAFLQTQRTPSFKCVECRWLDREQEHWRYKQGLCRLKQTMKWPQQPRACIEFEKEE